MGGAARVALAVLVGLLAGGCGGGQTHGNLFSQDWNDDGGRSIELVRQRLGNATPARGVDVAIGVAGNNTKIIGLPLGGGARWTFAHPLDARPLLASTVVVASGGGELFALEATTGRKLWARPTGGLSVHGAGDDGTVTVITLSRVGGSGSTLLAVTHDGGMVRQVETDKSLGVPAVIRRLAFIPWGTQYVSVYDLSDGDEVGRILLRQATSRAWTVGGALYFGEVGVFRFDGQIREASRGQATYVALPAAPLPGSPKLMTPGDQLTSPVADARDKIRLYAMPTGPTGPLGFDNNRFYATYFRLVMGFTADRSGGVLSWVHTHPTDILGGAAASGGVVLCDDQGKVTVIDAKGGGVVSELDLGEPVKSCAVQVDGFRPSGTPRETGTLAAQIAVAVEDRDLELVTGQHLLLRELATSPDEEATKTLVELASDPRTSPALISDTRAELASRRNGAAYMLAALERHYDFLKDVLLPPPVGPLADALAAIKEKRAAPLLASHLLDPADTDDDIKRAAAALVVLAGPSERPAMKQFFAMYRAAPEDPVELADAVVAVGQALLGTDGSEGRALVDQAIRYPMTNGMVKSKLSAVVEAADAEKGAEKREGQGKSKPPSEPSPSP